MRKRIDYATIIAPVDWAMMVSNLRAAETSLATFSISLTDAERRGVDDQVRVPWSQRTRPAEVERDRRDVQPAAVQIDVHQRDPVHAVPRPRAGRGRRNPARRVGEASADTG